MNKEIEEMARDIQSAVNGCAIHWAELIAKYLTEQGYRQCKDKVVLDKEEWASLHEEYAKALYEKDKQAREETAREILTELYCTPKEKVENKIKELARFIGVEVEE